MKRSHTAIALFLSLSCASVRHVTYPTEFRFMTRDQVRSVMWRLAEEVTVLDTLLRQPVVSRDGVVKGLGRMEEHAAQLGSAGQASNHPRIDRNLPGFQRELQAARMAAEAEPPNYYLAGSVIGGCNHCHGSH